MPELPPLGTVSNIEPSNHAVGTAYVAVDTHQIGIFEPFLYKTTDFGANWERIDGHSGTPEMGAGWSTKQRWRRAASRPAPCPTPT